MEGKILPLGTAVSGNFNTDAAGTVKAGTPIVVSQAVFGTISALVNVDVETNTLTMQADWQASDDGSTYYTVGQSNNAATVVLATGTAGADASVEKLIPAPLAVYAWKYARCVVTSGVTTGNTVDTYSIKNKYLRD
jgi:hypothetical protein